MELLRASGPDRVDLPKDVGRLLALNPKAEYDPSDIAPERLVRPSSGQDIARRVLASHR